jgi:WD40 repeat protein
MQASYRMFLFGLGASIGCHDDASFGADRDLSREWAVRTVTSPTMVNSLSVAADGRTVIAVGSPKITPAVLVARVAPFGYTLDPSKADGPVAYPAGDYKFISHAVFGPAHRHLGFWGYELTEFDPASGKIIKEFVAHKNRVVSDVAGSADGATIATVSSEYVVTVWDTKTWTRGVVIRDVFPICVTYIGNFVVCGGTIAHLGLSCGGVKVCDPATGVVKATFSTGAEEAVKCVVASKDGKMLCMVSESIDRKDSRIVAWKPDDPADAGVALPDAKGSIRCIRFSPDGRALAAACGDGTVRFWKVSDWSYVGSVKVSERSILSFCYMPDGAMIVATDGTNEYVLKKNE